MKNINMICILALLSSQVQAEPTPAGTTPTYTNENGGFTYYNMDGSPVAPGTRAFISPIGGGFITDDQGRFISPIFATPEEAEVARNATPDCSGAVFGPGPSGNPCNGGSSSGASASGVIAEIDEDAYNEKVFELNAVLYGATEIGAKSCKPAGEKMPGSLESWFSAVKKYSLGETNRDKALNEKIDAIQDKITALTSGASVGKDLQVESIQLQIETVMASIDSISGAGGRIPLREALILAALESTKFNVDENIKTVKAFKDMVDVSFVASTDAAKAACERKKKIQECTMVTHYQGRGEANETSEEVCKEVEVADPVPGCDVALAKIPAMRAGPAQSYGEVYLTKMPSTAENDRLQMFENEMTSAMESIPKSNDANYDWSSPMEGALKVMKLARKDSGAKCPEGPKAPSKDPNVFNTKELNVTANEIMSKAATSFLEKIGAPENSKETAAAFTAAWTEADNVIGQAAYRAEYFSMVKSKANTILAFDKQKLSNLQITKAKLEKYLKDIKAMLASQDKNSGTGNKATNSAATASASAAKSAANTLTLASGGGKFVNKGASAAIAISGAAAVEEKAKALSLDPTKNAALFGGVKTSSTTFGTSTLGGTSASLGDLNLSGQSMAIAKKTMASIGANQKKLDTILNASTSSGSSNKDKASAKGSEDKFAKMFEAVTKSKTAAASASSFEASMEKALDKVNESPDASEIYKSASSASGRYYDDAYGGGSTSSVRRYEKNMGYSSPSGSTSSNYSGSSSSGSFLGTGKSSPEVGGSGERSISSDASVISQSIAARKTKHKDTYSSNDDDSLFERVTKAYIRNYEKVENAPAK